MITGLGIDFGPSDHGQRPQPRPRQPSQPQLQIQQRPNQSFQHHPEHPQHHQHHPQQHQQQQQYRAPSHHQQRPLPAAPCSLKPSTAASGYRHNGMRPSNTQRRVRIASGQPGVMGYGAGHTTDEDIFSSPESTSSAFTASSAGSEYAIRGIMDPRFQGQMKLPGAYTDSDAGGSTYAPSVTSSTDLSATSPAETETSATSYSSLPNPGRSMTFCKQASHSTLPTSASAKQSAPSAAPVSAPLMPRSKSSTSIPSAAHESSAPGMGLPSAFRDKAPRPLSMRGERAPSRGRGGIRTTGGRVVSHNKTQSWDGGPIPVLKGQGDRLLALKTIESPGVSQIPNDDGMVSDGFGGFKRPEASKPATPPKADDQPREAEPQVSSQQQQQLAAPAAVQDDVVSSPASSTVTSRDVDVQSSAASSTADSYVSSMSSSSSASYTSGAHPTGPLHVGSFYGEDGLEAARLDAEGRYGNAEAALAERGSSTTSMSRSTSSGAPIATLMRAPTREQMRERPKSAGSEGAGDSAAAEPADQVAVARMRSVRGFRGLEGAERGEAMVSLDEAEQGFRDGGEIRWDQIEGKHDDDVACQARPGFLKERSNTALPEDKQLSQSRNSAKKGMTRSMSEGVVATIPASGSGSNLDRHGTLINASANPARRSRDLQRLLGDSRRKAASTTASDSDQSSKSTSPIKRGGATGLQRSNAVGSSAAPPAILEGGRRKEARVNVDVLLESDLVVEGGMLRGRLEINVRKPTDGEGVVMLGQPKVRVVGFEELLGGDDTRHIFFHHGALITGASNAGSQPFVLHGSPNLSMPENDGSARLSCYAGGPDFEGYAPGREGAHSVPFSMELPIGKGVKGTYRGKNAHVRYIVIGSIKLKDTNGGGRSIAHFYRHVELFPYLNPAVVLSSAPRPTQASGEKGLFLGGSGKVKVTASLHRPTWIAGQRVYVNVSVNNATTKRISSATFTLIRTVTLFRPRPELGVGAATDEIVDADACSTTTTRKKVTEEVLELGQKGSKGFVTAKGWWTGVEAGGNLDFSHHLAIPTDALTVVRGRHVEISYHIRVAIGSSLSSDVYVELPMRIVNFISLDPPVVKAAPSFAAPTTTTRAWGAAIASPGRNSSSNDDAIALVKSADALRSPLPSEIGRGEPNMPSGAPSNLRALSERAAQRNSSQTHLTAPADPSRGLQHQRSLEFINSAIRSATARRSSNSKPSDGAGMPMGLGIDVPDGAESSSGETMTDTDVDVDATPMGSSTSSFAGSEDEGAKRGERRSSDSRRQRRERIHPSCMPYEHIDVPAPSFGFPFTQLPAAPIRLEDADDYSDDEEDAANRTLGLNQDSVDEVDLAVDAAAHDQGSDAFQRIPSHDGDESVDPDMSTETVREGENSSGDEPGEELSRPVADGARPVVIIDDASPERPARFKSEAKTEPQAAPTAAVRRGSIPNAATQPRRMSAIQANSSISPKKSNESLRKQASNNSLRSSTATAESPVKVSTSRRDSSVHSAGVTSSPSRSLKNKSSFTFATSSAPLRIAKADQPIHGSVKQAGTKAKVAPSQVVPHSEPESAKVATSSRKSRPLPKEPTVLSVPAPTTSRGHSCQDEETDGTTSPATSQEALTPESAHEELGVGESTYDAEAQLFSGGGLGLMLNHETADHQTPKKSSRVASASPVKVAETKRDSAVQDSIRSGSPARAKTLRKSTSTASLKGSDCLPRSRTSGSLASLVTESSPQRGGFNGPSNSVKNKIAMLENRQQALKEFTRPASGSWDTSSTLATVADSHPSTPPRHPGLGRGNGRSTPASEPRPTAGLSSLRAGLAANSLTPGSLGSTSSTPTRGLSRQTSKASLAPSVASVGTTSSQQEPSWMKRQDSLSSNASFKAPMLRGVAP
ncbi:unnamed protein product [Jaminaea pallidilutea]